jgi:hypothetical protein
MATRGAIEIGAAIFGLGNAGRLAAGMGGQLLTLRFGREDESEADLVGLELAARAGFNPQAGVTLWQKMAGASKGGSPEFMSTHPTGPTRIRDIEAKLGDAQIIDVTQLNANGKVVFGSTVHLVDVTDGSKARYQIVGEDEADIKSGLLSVGSPIARALIGKKEGDEHLEKARAYLIRARAELLKAQGQDSGE